jgi:PAS domain S-box-containing protein
MHFRYTPYIWLLLLSAAVMAALGLYAWRHRSVAGARPFAVVCLVAVVWAVANGLEMAGTDLPTKLFWANLHYACYGTLAIAWLALMIEYTGHGKWLTARRLALLAIIPALTVILAWTNDLHGLMRQDVRLDTSGDFAVIAKTYGPWFWVAATYNWCLSAAGIYLAAAAMRGAQPLYRRQTLIILIGYLLPLAWNLIYALGLSPVPRHDLAPVLAGVSGILVGIGLFRFQLFDIRPIAYDAVIDGMEDGVVVLDVQHRIVDLNPAARRMLGQPASQAIGQPADTIPAGRNRLAAWPALIALYRDPRVTQAELVLDQEGAQRTYDAHVSPLTDAHSRSIGQVIAWRDITQRKQAEEALRQSNAELQTRNEELDAFAHTVAHDLKDSLAFFVGVADLLGTDYPTMPDEEVDRWLQAIEVKGMKMSRVTDAMLLLATVRQGQAPVGPVEMAGIVAEACQRLAPTIQEHQAEIVAPLSWPAALGYGPWLEEVWLNLIDNAIKHGGRPPRVELGYSLLDDPPGPELTPEQAKTIRFWVRDNGAGLTPEKQARLFKPLAELPRVRDMGHGLGLSIVRRIVERLGGQVAADNDDAAGHGAVFSFTLPGAAAS